MGKPWALAEGRTQIQGYIQYTAYGSSDSLENATILAKGRALSVLTEECGKVPIGTKAFEFCSEKVENRHYSYIRYSVKRKLCIDKLAPKNKSLEATLTEYKNYLQKISQSKNTICIKTGEDCVGVTTSLFMSGRKEEAKTILGASCNKGNRSSCYQLYDFYLRKKEDKVRASEVLKKGCVLGDKISCILAYEKMDKREKRLPSAILKKRLCKFGIYENCPKDLHEIEVMGDSVQPFEL